MEICSLLTFVGLGQSENFLVWSFLTIPTGFLNKFYHCWYNHSVAAQLSGLVNRSSTDH